MLAPGRWRPEKFQWDRKSSGRSRTSAHVIGSVARSKPSVRIAGTDLPAKDISEDNFENVDLTLLSIDEQKLPIYLQVRRMPLCEKNSGPASQSSSQFPKERRARISSHR
jgi:hypothetical protein